MTTATRTRLCPRHLDTVPATHLNVPVQFGGTYGELDLCDAHMATCTTDLWAWLRDATLQEDLSERDLTGKVLVPVRRRDAEDDTEDDTDADHKVQVVLYVGDGRLPEPLRLTALQRAQLPGTAMRWHLSDHTITRMQERQLTEYQVRLGAERPQQDTPSRHRDAEHLRIRRNGNVKVVVDPATAVVVTAMPWTESWDFDIPALSVPARRADRRLAFSA